MMYILLLKQVTKKLAGGIENTATWMSNVGKRGMVKSSTLSSQLARGLG